MEIGDRCHQRFSSHALFGREKEARGQASEASADHSIFQGFVINPVNITLAGKNLHLVISHLRDSAAISLNIHLSVQLSWNSSRIVHSCQSIDYWRKGEKMPGPMLPTLQNMTG
jgi:hypothetical protein